MSTTHGPVWWRSTWLFWHNHCALVCSRHFAGFLCLCWSEGSLMKYFSRVFTPTRNRRLNELIGFVLIVSAILLFLALASYSPLDPSFDTAAPSLTSHPARNWIGLFGAVLSDLLLQFIGITVFFVPVLVALLGLRWFR